MRNRTGEKSLKEILYLITENGELHYLKELVKNEQVKQIIKNVSNRNKCKSNSVIQYLNDCVVRYYQHDESEYVEERFLNLIKKYLGRKAREI